jgi:hypothetical protein
MKEANGKEIIDAAKVLRSAMLFGLTRRAWSNRCMASREKIRTKETDANGVTKEVKLSRRVNATKQLIVCDEYDALITHLGGTYEWVLGHSMLAAGIGRGINLVRRDYIETVIEKVEADRRILRVDLLPPFLAVYPQRVEDASRPVNEEDPEKGGLGSLFDADDYPSVEELGQSFDIIYRVFALSVPDELPEEIRKSENAKLRETLQREGENAVYALREGLNELVAHAIERLHVKVGEKPKVFVADNLVGGFVEFFESFRARNIMDDAQLEEVVAQAQDIVAQFAPNIHNIKSSTPQRNRVAEQLSTVKVSLDGLLKNRPSRRFTFED